MAATEETLDYYGYIWILYHCLIIVEAFTSHKESRNLIIIQTTKSSSFNFSLTTFGNTTNYHFSHNPLYLPPAKNPPFLPTLDIYKPNSFLFPFYFLVNKPKKTGIFQIFHDYKVGQSIWSWPLTGFQYGFGVLKSIQLSPITNQGQYICSSEVPSLRMLPCT